MKYAEKVKQKTRLDADDRIIFVRVKVERAKKHLRDLAAEVLAYEETTIVTRDPNTGAYPNATTISQNPSKFVKVGMLSFDSLMIAGDLIHNLRSALDHLAQQLVAVGISVSPLKKPLTPQEFRQIEFPIAETATKYESSKAGKVKGMLPEAVEAIDRLKPYKGGNDAPWRIHELDNTDKHRSLLTVARDHLFTADWIPGPFLVKAQNPHFAGVEAKMEQDIQSEIQKAVSESKIGQSNALLPSLHQLVDFVDNLVLGFKPLLDEEALTSGTHRR